MSLTVIRNGELMFHSEQKYCPEVVLAATKHFYPRGDGLILHQKYDFLLVEFSHSVSMLFFRQLDELIEANPDLKSAQVLYEMRRNHEQGN